MTCGSCGTENAAGQKFCAECGAALAVTCPSCGAALDGDGEVLRRVRQLRCPRPGRARAAEALGGRAAARLRPLRRPRRLHRRVRASATAEDTRELLSRYFETCRRLIALYGGTVEKFIGDAVMAVWGTPTATEDDAERAVRAALDLVAAVSALGDEVGRTGASSRARGCSPARRR